MTNCSLYRTVRETRPVADVDFSLCAEAFPRMMQRLISNPSDRDAARWLASLLSCSSAYAEKLAETYRKLPALPHDERRQIKQTSLPVCVPAGTFSGSHAAANLKTLSGIMVLDFDSLDQPDDAARRLLALPFISGAARSCSGTGLYAWTTISRRDPQTYRNTVRRLTDGNIFPRLASLAPDPACKDISRARYLSPYTPLLRPEPAQAADLWLSRQPSMQSAAAPAAHPWRRAPDDTLCADARQQQLLARLARLCAERSIDLTAQEPQWYLLMGAYARTFPHDQALSLVQRISSIYPDYTPEATRAKFERVYAARHNAWTAEQLLDELEDSGILAAGWRSGLLQFAD